MNRLLTIAVVGILALTKVSHGADEPEKKATYSDYMTQMQARQKELREKRQERLQKLAAEPKTKGAQGATMSVMSQTQTAAPSSREELRLKILDIYDANDNGKLDKDELTLFSNDRMMRFDANNNGKVEGVELKNRWEQLISQIKKGKLSDEEKKALIKKLQKKSGKKKNSAPAKKEVK